MILVGLDTETTGLEWAEGHRLIEVALLVYNSATRAKVKTFVQRINPQRSILAEAQRVHGIALSDLIDEPVWAEVAPKVSKILSVAHLVIAHNGVAFDEPFVSHELKVAGYPPISVPIFDTMLSARWATPQGKLPTLGELCFACGVEYDPTKAHAAEYDVDVMVQCFFRGVDWGFYKLPELDIRKAA